MIRLVILFFLLWSTVVYGQALGNYFVTNTCSGNAMVLDGGKLAIGTISNQILAGWVKHTVDSVNADQCPFSISESSGNRLYIYFNANGLLCADAMYGYGGPVEVGGTRINMTFTKDRWYHVALCRLGNTIQLWVDGKMVDSNSGNLAGNWGSSMRLHIRVISIWNAYQGDVYGITYLNGVRATPAIMANLYTQNPEEVYDTTWVLAEQIQIPYYTFLFYTTPNILNEAGWQLPKKNATLNNSAYFYVKPEPQQLRHRRE